MKRLFILLAAFSAVITACNNTKSNSTSATDSTSTDTTKTNMLERNRQTALRNVNAVMKRDTAAFAADFAPDAVDYADGGGTPVKGIDSIKASLEMFLAAFPDLKGENMTTLAEGNHVAVFGDYSGTFKGNLMGMKPTGKSFHIKDVDLYTFNDEGKITEHRSVQSFSTIMMQVGGSMK